MMLASMETPPTDNAAPPVVDAPPGNAAAEADAPESRLARLAELVRVFGLIGITGFGGPAAHLALMEEQVVRRRGWIPAQEFVDYVGATNLVPGPNAPEVAAHVGLKRAGWLGLPVAGLSFVLPGVLLTLLLAWAYRRYGTMPQAEALLWGVKPVVVAVVAMATWRMGRVAVRGGPCMALAAVALGLALAGFGEIPILFGMGVAGMFVLRRLRRDDDTGPRDPVEARRTGIALAVATVAVAALAVAASMASAATAAPGEPGLAGMGFYFAKIGAVLYGSGYVLIAFIEGGLVNDLKWLTQPQLLDAIAVGQLTPGPLTTTATFIGYQLLGWPGALVATLGMFLPGFGFVAVLSRVLPRLRRSPWAAAFLDSVNAVAIALMAEVVLRLGMEMLVSAAAWGIAVAALVAGVRFRVATPLLMVAGALVGLLAAR